MTSAGQGIAVRTLANSIKAAVEQHWSMALPPVIPLPERRYVAAGDPGSQVFDCEQLVVSLAGVGFGPAEDAAPPATPRAGSPASVMSVRHVVFDIALVRCIPTPTGRGATPPTVDALQEAGDRYMTDAGVLSQALVRWASRARSSLLPNDGASSVKLGVIEPGEASGGFVAMAAAAIVTCAALE
jgi:hypothetical protein